MANLYKIKGNLYALRGKLVKLDARAPFTIKINTALGNGFNSFTLPLSNHATNVKVRTSDGQSFTITNYLDSARTINFASAGIYTIELRGVCGWVFNNTGDCQKLIGVTHWGSSFKFSYLMAGFYGCINLGLNEGLPDKGQILYNGTGTVSLQNTFKNCNLTSYGNPSFLQKLKITSLSDAFQRNRIPYICENLLKGQTYLTNCGYMFYNNIQLIDIHEDAFKSLINCTIIQGYLRGCRLTTVKKKWHQSFGKVTVLAVAYYGNRITSVEQEAFDSMINVTDVAGVLGFNNLPSIPNKLFYNNKKVTLYNSAFRDQRVPMSLPAEIWDLSVISIVTNWDLVLRATNTTLSPTGTVQPIWDYASPTATKTDALINCTALTNYDDSPLEWR